MQIVTLDKTGLVTYANDQYFAISGYTSDEVIGEIYWLLDTNLKTESYVQDVWSTIRSGDVWHDEVKHISKQGNEHWESITLIPFLDENTNHYKYISLGVKVKKMKEVQSTLDSALKNSFEETIKHLENTIFKYKESSDG